MDIAADGDGARDGLDVAFFHEYGADDVAKGFHVLLWKVLTREEGRDV